MAIQVSKSLRHLSPLVLLRLVRAHASLGNQNDASAKDKDCTYYVEDCGADTELLKEMIYDGYDIVSIAASFKVNVNLVAIKVAATKFDGVNVPFIPKQNFMGTIEDCRDFD